MSFLIESVLLALLGGALGCLLALPVRSFTTGTMSFATFSELAFRFQVTPGMLLAGPAFSAFMGLLGGFLPARKAATMPIVDSLRQAKRCGEGHRFLSPERPLCKRRPPNEPRRLLTQAGRPSQPPRPLSRRAHRRAG